MRQVCLVKGEVRVVDVPAPVCGPGGVLVRTACSVISTGTELAAVGSGGGAGLARRALARPELARRVLQKVATVGLRATIDLIKERERASVPLGYSAAGEVVEVGRDVRRFKVGDVVACAGAGHASHAEVNFVPENLVAAVPADLPVSSAAFATLVAIALHGVRRVAPTLGEQVAVVGLGLVGQLAVQLLRCSGCRVLGIDPLSSRVELARRLGMEAAVEPGEDATEVVARWTADGGADAVLVCASGTDPSLLDRALDLCRAKGRLVLVGNVPIGIEREAMYRKEIDVLISRSDGPGRYDPAYEERGEDYPLPYVRWTAGRNLVEALRLMSAGSVRVAELVAATHDVSQAPAAYAQLRGDDRPLAVLLDYGRGETPTGTGSRTLALRAGEAARGQVVLGVIGAGSFFRSVHLPNLRRHGGFFLKAAATRTGLRARDLGVHERIPLVTTDAEAILADPEIEAVLIATRHDLHAPLAIAALRAGKHVLVEKPLGLTVEECRAVVDATTETGRLLAVVFNRRFAPLARSARRAVEQIREPRTLLYRVNAGALPPEHWLLDPREGGGRLRGEGVHFFDFARWLIGGDLVSVQASAVERAAGAGPDADNVSVTLRFADGSLATILYLSRGSPDLSRERIEVLGAGRAVVLTDFKRLELHGFAGAWGERRRDGDRGHAAVLDDFHRAVRGEGTLGVTAEDGYWATWCAEQAIRSLAAAVTEGPRPGPR